MSVVQGSVDIDRQMACHAAVIGFRDSSNGLADATERFVFVSH